LVHEFVAVLDAGTTNIKVLIFNESLELVHREARSVPKHHPHPDWAEQDANAIATTSLALLDAAIAKFPTTRALGIANQRETIVAWDKLTGAPLHPAILWEDMRTRAACIQLSHDTSLTELLQHATGLTLSPYFSATKMQWLLAQLGQQTHEQLAFGTIDSWLIYRLTGRHVTDYTNASRTMLFNVHTLAWDDALLAAFGIKRDYLPEALPSVSNFGVTTRYQLPILAVAGDQQASLYAAGTTPGTLKVTYGTGIFPMKLVGSEFVTRPGYTTTLAISAAGAPQYALEAKIDGAAARTTPVLHDAGKLDEVVRQLATETAPIIHSLLGEDVQEVVVDGGMSLNDTLIAEQERLSGLPLRRLSTPEGTALGVATLLMSTMKS
jgi:glycerol kinase